MYFRAEVVGDSMLPTYRAGDWLIVRRSADFRVGQVVVARFGTNRDLVVKRIAEISEAGAVLHGDNPGRSTDSRTLGAVPVSQLLGRVVCRYWPLWRT